MNFESIKDDKESKTEKTKTFLAKNSISFVILICKSAMKKLLENILIFLSQFAYPYLA